MTSKRVGFIGLGQMGFGMASNLLAGGHGVLAFDTRAEPLDRLAAKGGQRANGPAAIGAECDTVIVIVANEAQVRDVVCGTDGLLKTMHSGRILVSSTIDLTVFLDVMHEAQAEGVTV